MDDLEEPGGGGLIGWVIGELLVTSVGVAGSIVIIVALTVVSLILISGLSLVEIAEMVRNLSDQISDWRRRRALASLNHQPVSPLPYEHPRPAGLLGRVMPSSQDEPHQQEGRMPSNGAPVAAGSSPRDYSGAPPGEAARTTPPGILFPRVVGAQSWRIPPLEGIFEEGIDQEISQQEIRQRVKIIEDTLVSFGIEAKVREINHDRPRAA